MRKISVLCGAAIACVATLAAPSPAAAGGYDTPMLYSARHMGMGGAAVAYVNDGSSLFHNPAGMGHTEQANLLLNVTFLTGNITSTPNDNTDTDPGGLDGSGISLQSEQTNAPLFLLGGTYRFTDWLVGGFGFYPVASAGADYVYSDVSGTEYADNTTLLFLEASMGLALDFTPWGVPGLRIGATWRITYVSLSREQEYNSIDFKATGVNFSSFRVGIQYQPMDELELGLNWRSKSTTEIEDSGGTLLGATDVPIVTEFVLPDRLVFGVAANLGDARIATDLEIGFNGENDVQVIEAGVASPQLLDNVLDWSHAVTLRVGGEYRFLESRLPVRLGYVYDGKTASEYYPTAFGTPPVATNVVTAGLGWIEEDWQLNLAYAYRWGSTTLTDTNPPSGDPNYVATCLFCSGDGEYDISLSGIYVDFSYDW